MNIFTGIMAIDLFKLAVSQTESEHTSMNKHSIVINRKVQFHSHRHSDIGIIYYKC
jgi:hypothetical protein